MLSTSLKLFLESERCTICSDQAADDVLSPACCSGRCDTLQVATCLHESNSECCTFRSFWVLLHTPTFTHKRFYTQTLLHTDAFTQTLLHTDVLHKEAFTHRSFHTQRLLHTEAFTYTDFYTQKLLHADPFTHRDVYAHTQAFTHKLLHTQRLLHTDAFTHRHFYTETLLRTNTFTHRDFYTQRLLHTETFTHRRFYTQTLLHTDAFTHGCFYTHTHLLRTGIANLMWNASYVQKTLQLTWQERVDDTIRERSKSNPSLVTARSNWSIWTKSFSLYWQQRNTDCDNSALKREALQKIDMPFLGVAGSQNCKSWSHSAVWQRKRNRQRINNAQLMNRNRRSTVLTIAGT